VQPTAERCNGEDDDCDGSTDEDLGQTTCGRAACRHTVANCVHGQEQACDPLEGASPERCNEIDDDCDGATDEGLSTDEDGDGHYTPGSCAQPADDCDDEQARRHPGHEEVVDDLDNDCDGATDCEDEDEVVLGCPSCITFNDPRVDISGEQYCLQAGLHCVGFHFFDTNDCSDEAYTECWGSNPLRCCGWSADTRINGRPDHAGAWLCHVDCPEGAEEGWDGACADVDECQQDLDDCGANATCHNNEGSYECRCDLGFTGDGRVCTPVDPAPGCIRSGDAAWHLTGFEYCGQFGLGCVGTAYYRDDPTCDGAGYTECWGAEPGRCCEFSMRDRAGQREGAAARWTCE